MAKFDETVAIYLPPDLLGPLDRYISRLDRTLSCHESIRSLQAGRFADLGFEAHAGELEIAEVAASP